MTWSPIRIRLPSPIRSLASDRGVAAVEFALVAPVLVLLLLGVLDLGWRLFAEYRLGRAAAAAAELTARARELHEADLEEALRATAAIAAPFGPAADGAVIVSGVRNETGIRPVVLWQRVWPPAATVSSRVGPPGGAAELGALRLEVGESVIVAELFHRFEPLVGLLFRQPEQLYYRWIAAPRYGPLAAVLP
ncbi:hypothetical protein HRbin40_00343 [bacterium HR40]|nr:hypothetical protein HRbin40_00343 [bacterium HR40]